MRPQAPLQLLPLLFVLAGCGADAADAGYGPARCFGDDQCPAGDVCFFGECAADRPTFPIDLWVSPLRVSELLPQPVAGVADRGMPLDVTVRAPVPVEVASDVPLKATFTAVEAVPRPLSFSVEVQPEGGETARAVVGLVGGVVDGQDGGFDPLHYDVTVLPLATECCAGGLCVAPSVTEEPMTIESATSLVFDHPAAVRLEGRVVASVNTPVAVPNVQVQAFDPGGSAFSLPARTDESGRFCLAVPRPGTGDSYRMTLRIGPSERWPTVEFPNQLISADEAAIDVGEVVLTGLDVLTPIPVTGRVVDTAGHPVAGARLGFDGSVQPRGTFSASATTDADGLWQAGLLPGTYEAWVQPAADATAARVTLSGLDPADVDAPVEVVAPPRARVEGRLVGPDGQPLADAEVAASREPDVFGEPVVAGALDFATRTDADGRWSLRLDPGQWVFRFEPAPGSDLPWVVGRTVQVGAGQPLVTLPEIQVEPAVELPGRVGSEDGAPLADFKVEAFGRTPTGRAVHLWEARSDAEGHFRLLLPPDSLAP